MWMTEALKLGHHPPSESEFSLSNDAAAICLTLTVGADVVVFVLGRLVAVSSTLNGSLLVSGQKSFDF